MRNGTIDYLKLCLAIMVVGIHTNLGADINPVASHFLVDYLFRIAVPIFFMINGYYALAVIGNPRRFVRWSLHIWLLFTVWTLIYGFDALRNIRTVTDIMNLTFVGYFHLWYLPAVLAAGGVFHLMRRVSTPWLMALMIIGYAAGLFTQYTGNYHLFRGTVYDHIFQHYPIYRNFLCMGVPFFGIGLLLARHGLSGISRALVNIGLVSGVLLLLAEYAINRYFGVTEGLDVLFSLPVLATAVFLKALQRYEPAETTEISDMATLIFFLHPLILRILETHVTIGRSYHLFIVVFIIALISPTLARINAVSKRVLKFSII
ncbi:acyltransferase family protein [Asticcacaulis sp. W401b]|uniref:acyltransferase family protein n=1 Tax=Asticcacaulis sp. W401b TaxID=3388666 RepID=UPI0039705390